MSEDSDKRDDEPRDEEEGGTLSGLMVHLIELRSRLLRSIVFVLVIFIGLAPFANQLYSWLAGPLISQLPKGASMIAIDVAAPFFVPFKLTMLLAVVIAIPFLLYQLWAFVAPGLYKHEKRLVLPLLLSSTILFYTGMAFAYYAVFPIMFRFFSHATPAGVQMMTDIGAYLGFVSNMFLAFGAAFEVPVAIVLLTALGLVSPPQLSRGRPYVIVGAFVVAMILTPPDVFSQIMLAVPLLVLFEAGLLASRLVYRRRKEREEEEDDYEMDEQAMDRALDDAAGEEQGLESKDRSE
jgi:sec-independent protein translocase protein TatC